MKKLIITIAMLLALHQFSFAQSIQRAQLFKDHGLSDQAKVECIKIITSDRPDDEKAKAYYILGLIAFDQNRISTALGAWTTLNEEYPKSSEAIEVYERIKELAEIVGETQRESLDNAIARSYIRHGDFWARGKDSIFTIDTSWISNVEAAVKWYDKTIQEFPGTPAARIAYEEKMRTILGWEATGRRGASHGTRADPEKYIPLLVSTFNEYQKAFPQSGQLQAFRYQIAQAYWRKKDWQNTRLWLNRILEESGDQTTFYSDLAKRRLLKVEY